MNKTVNNITFFGINNKNMKTIILINLVSFFLVVSIFAQSKENSTDLTPEIFAPGIISTEQFEFAGTFSADGKEYYFTRRTDEKGSANRIYYSQLTANGWTKPALASFAKDIFEFEPHINPTGTKLYFGSERTKPSGFTGMGEIWVTEKTNTGWTEPTFLGSPVNDGYSMYVSSTNNNTIYFTWFHKGQRGIFKSEYKDGKFQTPQKLSEEINYLQAAHPFIATDESYLIFDSNSELYISFRTESGAWTKAIKFGNEINKTKTEICASVSPDGKYLYFNRTVNGNGDIYRVNAIIIDKLKQK